MKSKRGKTKIPKNVSVSDELVVLELRNFIFLANSLSLKKTLMTEDFNLRENGLIKDEIVGNFEKVQNAVMNKEKTMALVREMKLDNLIKVCYNTRDENKNRMNELLKKAQAKRKAMEEEENFFRYNLGKKGKNLGGHFDNLIEPDNLLYNLKSYFPVEKKYLTMMENRIIKRNESNMNRYASLKRQMKKTGEKGGAMKPEEIVCQVCNSGDYQDKNLIVFCSLCNVSTHQNCYGMQKVPKEDWLCDLCIKFGANGKYLRCWMCNCRGGVLKESDIPIQSEFLKRNGNYTEFMNSKEPELGSFIEDMKKVEYPVKQLYDFYKESYKFSDEELKNEPVPQNMWVHSSCVLWNKYISVKDNKLKGFQDVPIYQFLKNCAVCNSSVGCTIKCCRDDCNVYYHVECGRRVKLFMEMIGSSNNHRFLMYCASHTPLMLKLLIEDYERRTKDDVIKFYKYIKRYLKMQKINFEAIESKKKLAEGEAESKEKGNKLELSELIRFLDPLQKQLIRDIKTELYEKPDYSTTIDLKMVNGAMVVNKVNLAKKQVFKNRIPQTCGIWKKIGKKQVKTAKNIFNRYQKINNILKQMSQNPDTYYETIHKEVLHPQEDIFEPNNENFDDQIYCICKKEWKGELMIECDRCREWFHPKCINAEITNEIEINNNHVLCFNCKEEYEKDYCENIMLLEIEDEPSKRSHFVLRKNSQQNDSQMLLSNDRHKIDEHTNVYQNGAEAHMPSSLNHQQLRRDSSSSDDRSINSQSYNMETEMNN